MAIIKTGTGGTDQLTVDPTSKAARVTPYTSAGVEVNPTQIRLLTSSDVVDVADRAARILGIVYGSQSQQLKQTAINFNLQTEVAVGGTLIDPRSIRALTSSDVVSALQSGVWNVGVNNAGGASAVNIQDGGNSITVDGIVTANQGSAQGVAAAWPSKLTDGTVINSFTPASTAATATQTGLVTSFSPNSPLPIGTNAIGSVTVSNFPATQPVSGTVTANDVPPSLTKGTQGATGFSTQDLKDAGRTAIILSATAIASVASEAMITFQKWVAGTVTTGITSYTVTTGKTFRVQKIRFKVRPTTPSTTVTFASTTFNVRSGALITSPLLFGVSCLMVTNMDTDENSEAIPDGLELASGSVIGISHVASGTAGVIIEEFVIIGYEY